MISMDVEVYSNNSISWREYSDAIFNLLSNLGNPNVQRNVLSVLFENFASNINLINSFLLYVNACFKERSENAYLRYNPVLDKIFSLLKRLFSRTKHNNPSSEQEKLLVNPVVLCLHFISTPV